jgi:ankyrin repeat protein
MLLSEAIDVIAIRHDVENFDRGYFDPNDRLTRHEDVAGYCSSLVSFVQDERGRLNLQLAHFSVKEYLMGSFIGYSPSPSVTITETCLTYLSSVQRDPTINHILKVELLYPFAVSAAIIWTTHAKYAEESGPTLDRIANFILDTSKLAVWQSLERLGRGRGVWFRSPETLQSRSGSGSRWYDHNPLAPAFHIACREGLVATAKRLISDGADIDAGRYVRDTPLVTASETGQEDIVRFLLDRSANGTSEALQAASGRGYEGIVKLLLDRGVDITSEALNAASYSASYSGREAIVRLFLDRSADINSSQAVEAASYSGHEAIVLLLLDRGANATSKALEAASYSGHEAIVLLLLDRGANATSKALEAASYSGHEAIVLLLLDRGANATNKALQHASGVYHKTTVQRLLDQGAKVTSEALCAAVKSGHEAVVQLLLERGTDVDISKALQVASTTEHEAVVQLLLNHGANATSEALRIALYAGHEAVVQLLLDRGANIDISRALLTASFSGHTAIVQLLLDRGASVTRKALCAASQSGHEGIVQLLQNFRGRQHQSNPRQLRPRT